MVGVGEKFAGKYRTGFLGGFEENPSRFGFNVHSKLNGFKQSYLGPNLVRISLSPPLPKSLPSSQPGPRAPGPSPCSPPAQLYGSRASLPELPRACTNSKMRVGQQSLFHGADVGREINILINMNININSINNPCFVVSPSPFWRKNMSACITALLKGRK